MENRYNERDGGEREGYLLDVMKLEVTTKNSTTILEINFKEIALILGTTLAGVALIRYAGNK